MFNHQRSPGKSWHWGSSEFVLLLFTWILPFSKSYFEFFPPETRVSSQDATAWMTFTLLSVKSVSVFDIFCEAVGLPVLKTQINDSWYLPFVFHYCLSRILLANNRFKRFLGGDATWVFLFTFSVLSALLVLLSISSYLLARYLSPISFPPLLLFHNLDFLFHSLNFRTAKGVSPRCQLTIFLSGF